ncbi:MAG: NUDIX domain-containing protein [Crocinitomicaceae bacterium]|nr:NUDIX domain-containing protein [Crocinitomicaceae bacterium]
MYKVFIDNHPKIYQLDSEEQLKEKFADHKFIEAAGGIVRRSNHFLFIKRNGKWDIPKGKLDKGESVEAAAVREIEEECGLIAPKIFDHLINTWHTYEHKGKMVLKKTYWYLLDEGPHQVELVPQEEEGITEVRFFTLEEFPIIKENTYLSIEEVINRLEEFLSI